MNKAMQEYLVFKSVRQMMNAYALRERMLQWGVAAGLAGLAAGIASFLVKLPHL